MKYYLHKELGHVVSLDDAEPADLNHLGSTEENWIPVHLHPGPGSTHREPSKVAKAFAVTFSILVASGVVALIAGLAAMAWKAAF